MTMRLFIQTCAIVGMVLIAQAQSNIIEMFRSKHGRAEAEKHSRHHHHGHEDGGCLNDRIQAIHERKLKSDPVYAARRARMLAHQDFYTNERPAGSFHHYSCLGVGPWGGDSECFLPEVTDAYMSKLDELPTTELRIRSNTVTDSIGDRWISDEDIIQLVNQASERFERDSKIKLHHLGIQVVNDDDFYNRRILAEEGGTVPVDDPCVDIPESDLMCIFDCDNPAFSPDIDFCEFTTGHVDVTNCTITGQSRTCSASYSACMNDCTDRVMQCFYHLGIEFCGMSDGIEEENYLQETTRMMYEKFGFVTGDASAVNQIETVFMKLDGSACGVGFNSNFLEHYGSYYGLLSPGPGIFVQQSDRDYDCNEIASNTYEHELGHVLSLYHTHQGNGFEEDTCDECASRNGVWNGGDFVGDTGVFPSPFDTVSPAGGSPFCDGPRCSAFSLLTFDHECGNITLQDGAFTTNACFDLDKDMETNLMSYSFLGDNACPQFDTSLGQRARMRCWVDRHEFRSTVRNQGEGGRSTPSLVTVVTGSSSSSGISVSWVPPLNTLNEAWEVATDGAVGYKIYRNPAFTDGREFATISPGGAREYVDMDVIGGEEYTYTVQPFTLGNDGPMSPASERIVAETVISSSGCTDRLACNFDPVATVNDGSCVYPSDGMLRVRLSMQYTGDVVLDDAWCIHAKNEDEARCFETPLSAGSRSEYFCVNERVCQEVTVANECGSDHFTWSAYNLEDGLRMLGSDELCASSSSSRADVQFCPDGEDPWTTTTTSPDADGEDRNTTIPQNDDNDDTFTLIPESWSVQDILLTANIFTIVVATIVICCLAYCLWRCCRNTKPTKEVVVLEPFGGPPLPTTEGITKDKSTIFTMQNTL